MSEHVGAVAWLMTRGSTRGGITSRGESQTTVKRDESPARAPPVNEAVSILFLFEVPVSMRRMQAASRVAVFFGSSQSETFS